VGVGGGGGGPTEFSRDAHCDDKSPLGRVQLRGARDVATTELERCSVVPRQLCVLRVVSTSVLRSRGGVISRENYREISSGVSLPPPP